MKKAVAADAGQGRKGTVWLTDEPDTALFLHGKGECVLFLETRENADIWLPGIQWRAQVPEEAGGPESWEEWLPSDFLKQVWQRFAGIPWRIWESDRLLLREMTETDAEAILRLWEDRGIARFMEKLPREEESLQEKIRDHIRYMYGFFGFGIWIVERKAAPGEKQSGQGAARMPWEEGPVIGLAGMQLRDGYEEPELGFCIAGPYRRSGYATEACRAVLEYGFEELELSAVRAVVHRDNSISLRLCEKLGFREDRQRPLADGALVNMRIEKSQAVPDLAG